MVEELEDEGIDCGSTLARHPMLRGTNEEKNRSWESRCDEALNYT